MRRIVKFCPIRGRTLYLIEAVNFENDIMTALHSILCASRVSRRSPRLQSYLSWRTARPRFPPRSGAASSPPPRGVVRDCPHPSPSAPQQEPHHFPVCLERLPLLLLLHLFVPIPQPERHLHVSLAGRLPCSQQGGSRRRTQQSRRSPGSDRLSERSSAVVVGDAWVGPVAEWPRRKSSSAL